MLKKIYTFPMTAYQAGFDPIIVETEAEWKELQKQGWIDANPWLKNGSAWGETPQPKPKE